MFSSESFLALVQSFLQLDFWGLVSRAAVFYVIILWLAIVVWTVKDAASRSGNVFFQVVSIILVILLTPLLGLPIYFIIRPARTLGERSYLEAEDALASETEKLKQENFCPVCREPLKEDYLYCPNCQTQVRKHCLHCRRLYLRKLQICPYCGKNNKEKRMAKHE
ncbi:hypothetical protein COT40_00610 [Candidatus Peregrinibacteria bacterium CG08_land_8_20_14_0_20_41_10]|nr:MAG: hypothetical protein COT40_00610 [Candidatus Peregrinibacteria bacterium CG08_land_8_20_14_0_20_41_10]